MQLGSYVLLSTLSQKGRLSIKATKAIVGSMVDSASKVSNEQFLKASVAFCEPQDQANEFGDAVVGKVLKLSWVLSIVLAIWRLSFNYRNIEEDIQKALGWQGSEKFVGPLLSGIVAQYVWIDILSNTILNNPQITRGNRSSNIAIHFGDEQRSDCADPPSRGPPYRRCHLSRRWFRSWCNITSCTALYNSTALSIYSSKIRGGTYGRRRWCKRSRGTTGHLIDCGERLEYVHWRWFWDWYLEAQTYTKGENAKAHADMIVASTSADQNVRVIAVNQLLKTLMSPASTQSLDLVSDQKKFNITVTLLTTWFQPSVYSALLARAHDTKASVIQALYSAPSAILPILSSSSESYIVAVTQALSTNSSRPLIRAHLSFLASHFCNANVSLIPEIFIKCFFPFLLFSKSKKETAKAVWEIIEAEKDGIGKYEILQGCVDDWRWQSDKPAGESIDVMASTNMALAARMAGEWLLSGSLVWWPTLVTENILASTEYSSHLESLLKTIRDENAHSRALAHLVARALLSRLSGDQRIDAAKNILEAMHLDTLEGMEDFSDGDSNNAMVIPVFSTYKNTLLIRNLSARGW